jgi:Holliday junction DNA helicase RuvA
MVSFLNGTILLKKDKFVIIEVAGIGYKVFLSKQTLLRLPEIGENLKVFTFQNVREQALDLYGFLTYEELEFFEILNDIKGVGPKAALEISVVGPLEKIKDKILKQDENVFAGIPGIGAKRASSIILELTGKIKTFGSASGKSSSDEAENALVQLGFSKAQVKEALSSLPSNITNTEERIKLALKYLSN